MLQNSDIANDSVLLGAIPIAEKKFSVIQEIAGAMVATSDINSLSYLTLDFAINYTGAAMGSLMLMSDKSELYILAARGISSHLIRNYRVKIGEGIAGSVAQCRQPVMVEDIEQDSRFSNFKKDRYRTRSFISCPIVSRNKLLGVLNINDKKDGTPFTRDELDLVTVIANQAAMVLEHASLRNQLRANAIELDEISKKLMETDTVKTDFLTRLSHDLRTPLNSIKGGVYYLLQSERLSEPERREFYDIISKEANNLIAIVENLLNFLRFEDETRIIKKSLLNLSDILNDLRSSKSLKTIFESRSLRLEAAIPEEISDIVGDKVWIAQFFLNLIGGLSLHLAKNDTIGLSVKDNDYIEVRLSLPRKVPESLLPYLFDSQHIFKSNQPEEGTRLYLARRIADVHKWNLNATDTAEGFILAITIPKSTRQLVETAINDSMGVFIDLAAEMMDVDTCYIMLCDELTGDLTLCKTKGTANISLKSERLRLDERIDSWVVVQGEALLIDDIKAHSEFSGANTLRHGCRSLLSVPLKIKGKVEGVISFKNKRTSEPFTHKYLVLGTAIAQRISKFIEQVRNLEYSGESLKTFMTNLNTLLESERKYHKKKGQIPRIIASVMDALGTSDKEKELALYASVIYDLGLTLIDEDTLQKKTLRPFEVRALRAHPHLTIDLLNNFEFSDDLMKCILHHHERYDGHGYPYGLQGGDIPLISRVLSVVDAYCAMITERPYGRLFTKDEALDEIRRGAGSIFDPRVVSALENAI